MSRVRGESGPSAEPMTNSDAQVWEQARVSSVLCSLLAQSPHEVVAALVRMAAGKRRSTMTGVDITHALERAGVPVFARRARNRLPAVPEEL